MGKIHETQRKYFVRPNCYQTMEKRVQQHHQKLLKYQQQLPQLHKLFHREITLPLTLRKQVSLIPYKVPVSNPINIELKIAQNEIEELQKHLQVMEEFAVALEKRIQGRIRELDEEITQL